MSVPELDPEIIAAMRRAEELGVLPVETATPEQARADFVRAVKELQGEPDEVFSVEDRDADGVPIRIYRGVETDGPSMALVYFHGGGWVVGSIDTHDHVTRALAKRTGIAVISVGYRLAPEHPYPAALEDAWKAASWVFANADELGLDVERIGVGGDSVGGCLAAIVARKGRDTGTPFATQLLIYPATSTRCDTQSFSLYQSGYGLTRDAMYWYWEQYLGKGFDGSGDPDISPGSLQDLRRLPRAIVVTAEADVLRDEAEAFAQRLFFGGVETEGYRYDGMIHGFLRMNGVVKRSNEAFDEIAESLRPFLEKGWREDFTALPGQSAAGDPLT
jgi:acetyl esterase/lipase